MKLEDRLTDDERAALAYAKALDEMHRPTSAQARSRAAAYEALHVALEGLDSVDTCHTILAHILARPDLSPVDLEYLGNRINREAWERGR